MASACNPDGPGFSTAPDTGLLIAAYVATVPILVTLGLFVRLIRAVLRQIRRTP